MPLVETTVHPEKCVSKCHFVMYGEKPKQLKLSISLLLKGGFLSQIPVRRGRQTIVPTRGRHTVLKLARLLTTKEHLAKDTSQFASGRHNLAGRDYRNQRYPPETLPSRSTTAVFGALGQKLLVARKLFWRNVELPLDQSKEFNFQSVEFF